jgi:hypothetical protein
MDRSSLTLRPSSLKRPSRSSARALASNPVYNGPNLPKSTFVDAGHNSHFGSALGSRHFQFVDCPPARSIQFLIENEIEFHFHN